MASVLSISASSKTALIFPKQQANEIPWLTNFAAPCGDGWLQMSYHQLLLCVNWICSQINYTQVRNEEISVVKCGNNISGLISILAAWKSKTTPLLVSDDNDESALNTLTNFYTIKKFPLSFNTIAPDFKKENIPATEIDLSELNNCAVIRTSGSEGEPSAVLISSDAVQEHLRITSGFFSYGENDKWLLSLPVYHVSGLAIVLRALGNQLSLVIPESLKAESISSSIEAHGINFLSLVNAQLAGLNRIGIKSKSNIKKILVGGGPSDSGVISESLKMKLPVCKVYGSTETFTMICATDLSQNPEKINTSGKCLTDVEIKLFDTDLNGGVIEGEIGIKSPTLLKAYLKDDQKLSARIKEGFFLTGDIGSVDGEGYITILMRRTDIIVSGGLSIRPALIEEKILGTGWVKEVCVTGMSDPIWGEIVTAVLVPDRGVKIDDEELTNTLKKVLDPKMLPKKYFFVEKLPRTELGKLKRAEIKDFVNSPRS